MNEYASKMIELMNRTGQPSTTTSTQTTKQPNEGLDISGLMMMLMLDKLFPGPKTSIGETAAPASGLDMRAIAGLAPSAMTSSVPSMENIGITQAPPAMDLMKLIQTIANLKR